jgi:AraC family transcriptional regulator
MTDLLEKALDLMRRAGFRASVGEIAAGSGLSPFQLARLFTAVLGVAPGAYMSRTRLEAAADLLLADPKRTLAEVAFDAGFESQQTFTRAFTRLFGSSPGRYRREGKMRAKTSTSRLEDLAVLVRAQKQLSRLGPLRIAGFSVTVDGSGRKQPSDAWEMLNPLLPVANAEEGYAVGVCWSETGTETFTYMAGVVLRNGAEPPAAMEVCDVPAQTYAIIRQHIKPGPFLPQLRAGMRAVWSERLPRLKLTPTGGPDFEVYPDDLVAGETAGWLEYRIPVVPRPGG